MLKLKLSSAFTVTSPLGWLKANAFQGQKPNGKDADDSDHGVNEDQLNKRDV